MNFSIGRFHKLRKHFVHKNKPFSDHLPTPMCLHNLWKLPNENSIWEFHYKTGKKLIKTYIYDYHTFNYNPSYFIWKASLGMCLWKVYIILSPLKFAFSCFHALDTPGKFSLHKAKFFKNRSRFGCPFAHPLGMLRTHFFLIFNFFLLQKRTPLKFKSWV